MPPVVTSNAVITCTHGGHVTLLPRQEKVSIDGGFVLCEGDLIGAPIVGCAQIGPGLVPCTVIVSTLPGSTSLKVMVSGRPVHVQVPIIGVTNGVPPGQALVEFAGQVLVEAS
jgi:hypothetical protein